MSFFLEQQEQSLVKDTASQKPRFLRFELPFPPFRNRETAVTKTGRAYTPAEKKNYMKNVAEYMEAWKGKFKGVKFIKASFLFVCPRTIAPPDVIPPAIWKQNVTLYKPNAPDLDNYLKPLQDSMSRHVIERIKDKNGATTKIYRGAGIIDDDAYIVDVRAIKVYCRKGQTAHVIIKLKSLTPIYEY